MKNEQFLLQLFKQILEKNLKIKKELGVILEYVLGVLYLLGGL